MDFGRLLSLAGIRVEFIQIRSPFQFFEVSQIIFVVVIYPHITLYRNWGSNQRPPNYLLFEDDFFFLHWMDSEKGKTLNEYDSRIPSKWE